MKLLFDQNLSHAIIAAIRDLFPDCQHVRELGLSKADDAVVWQTARNGGRIIVTKDADFHEMSLLHGAPPKVIWIRRGNCSTNEIVQLLRAEYRSITDWDAEGNQSILILY